MGGDPTVIIESSCAGFVLRIKEELEDVESFVGMFNRSTSLNLSSSIGTKDRKGVGDEDRVT